MRRNVTIDPLARAVAVEKPAIKEILSRKSGRIFDTRRFIRSMRHEVLVRLRGDIIEAMNAGSARIACAYCGVPVYLVASSVKAFFFRHRHEDGSCPAITRTNESEDDIRARKYAGVQESDAHKRLKGLIARSVSADRSFGEPELEAHWKSASRPNHFRRPDVNAPFRDLRIAFEGQLTTTFLSVVVGRKMFYRAEGALLCWILASFNPNNRRMTEDDIVFPNNSNVLVVDDETAAASESARRFMLKCYYRCPGTRRIDGSAVWVMDLVAFDELTLDVERQRVFLVDVEGEELQLRREAERKREEAFAAKQTANLELREAFLRFAALHHEDPNFPSFEEREVVWANFRSAFRPRGISLPERQWGELGLAQLVKCLLSAREGKPLGWKFDKLVAVAHHIFEQHPGFIMLFIFALRAYGHVETVKREDKHGAWTAKAERLRIAQRRGDERFKIDMSKIDLIGFLFPEVLPLVEGFLIKSEAA